MAEKKRKADDYPAATTATNMESLHSRALSGPVCLGLSVCLSVFFLFSLLFYGLSVSDLEAVLPFSYLGHLNILFI
ncbi:hypothetical protein I7I48_07030 [Histoplasma ohiense]|nr:hypothetical protein I7I48_07030 [Histoplasma ohiense (nom. inval.)]